MHLGLVALVVDDYDAAIRFFVDDVGFELVEDSPALTNDGRSKRWVVVRPPGAQTGVLLAQDARPIQATNRVAFFLQVDDFDEAHTRMLANGVRFLSEPRHEPYGTVAVWEDISGNSWDLLGPSSSSGATPGR